MVTKVMWEFDNMTGRVKSSHNGNIVLPSTVGQSAPDESCVTRTEAAGLGTIEECCLFKNPNSNSWVAYPSYPISVVQLPGVASPMLITWEANHQKPGEVISTHVNGTAYHRIFAGTTPSYWEKSWCRDKTTCWSEFPAAGEVTKCFVHWRTAQTGSVIGTAYPVIEEADEESLISTPNRLYTIAGVADLILFNEDTHTVQAKEGKDGEIIITLTPIATTNES